MVYRTGLARGIPGTNHLVWKMEVGDGAGIREFVFVDAHGGFVVDRINGIHEIDRAIHHERFSNVIWSEGDTLPFSDSTFTTQQNNEVNELIDVSAETYDLFSNITGGEWLSYDGNDRRMNAVYEATPSILRVRRPSMPLGTGEPSTSATVLPSTMSSPTSGPTPTPISPTI